MCDPVIFDQDHLMGKGQSFQQMALGKTIYPHWKKINLKFTLKLYKKH